MDTVQLPSYSQYKSKVDQMISTSQLTTDQGVILMCCFRARLNEKPVHVNYLMTVTGMSWKEINWTLNGLVLKGAIRRFEKKWYSV